MSLSAVGAALTAYRAALVACLSEPTPQTQKVLQVLNARDTLHLALGEETAPGAHQLQAIYDLDQQLRKQAVVLVRQLDFSTYRRSFPKSREQWWWWLDETVKSPSDWFFKGLTTLAWATSLGLLVTISSRFLLGGAGVVGLSAVALSNLLTLLKARSDLTEAGHQGLQKLLDRAQVPQTWRVRAQFGSTALLTSVLVAFWLALPTLSKQYSQRGQNQQAAGKLGSAEQSYNLAISLNPDNVNAHYNLGTLYEDIQDLEQAQTQYLIAIRGDFPEAYNNLARLYLQSPAADVNRAIALLYQGLILANQQQSYPETRYSLYKNLGWALLEQGQHAVAQSALETAIDISQEPTAQDYVNNPGSAYCLLAQTLEAQDQTETIPQWQRCCQLGQITNPEESTWLLLARNRLETANLDYDESCRPTAPPL